MRAENCTAKGVERVAYAERRAAYRPDRFPDVSSHVSRVRTYTETCVLREEIAQIKFGELLAKARRSAGLAASPDAPVPTGWVLSSEDPESGTAVYVRQQ